MENDQKILRLGEIDIVEYINKTHVVSDTFLVETQKHDLESYQEELNSYLHLAFLENCDPLLAILETYKECHMLLEGIEAPRLFLEEPKINLNAAESKEFERACRHFADDMSLFFTDSRYLVKADTFGDYYCVLTNDLLFIGEKAGDGKYTLRNSLARPILNISRGDSKLNIGTNTGISYALPGDKDAIDEFYDAIHENVEDFPAATETKPFPDIDHDLVEYYVETGQYKSLEAYIDEHNCPGEVVLGSSRRLQIMTIEELRRAMRIFSDSACIFNEFMQDRFAVGLHKINKVQRTQGFIDDTFDYLEEFIEEMDSICVEAGITRHSELLCMERLILRTFGFIEKRVFSKFCEISLSSATLELIKGRLRFQELDFTYLMKTLLERRDAFEAACVENAKKEITQRLETL